MNLDGLIKDKETALTAVNRHGWVLQYVDKSLKKDREVVLAAVKQFGLALQYASEEFKKDPEIVSAAVKKNRMAFQYSDVNLRNNRDFVEKIIKENGRALELTDKSLRNDNELILIAAVQKHGWPSNYLDASLWEDRDFVLNEVKKDGSALECAANFLKKDREIVLTAIKQHRWALRYVDESLKKDKEIVLAGKREHGWALDAAHESLWNDKDFVNKIIKENGLALRYASSHLKKDPELIQIAFESFGGEFDINFGLEKENISLTTIPYKELIKDNSKRIIASWSGGKDGCFALYKVLKDNNKLVYLLNCISNKKISFHEIDSDLLKTQTELLGVSCLGKSTTQDGYQREYVEALENLVIPQGIDAMVFGNIYVNEHKEWGEHVCEDVGIESVEPIWNENTKSLARKILDSNFEVYIVCANANLIDKSWVGKKMDNKFLEYAEKRNIDPCGEYGEFHTFVTDCPIFEGRIKFIDTEIIKNGDYWVLDVKDYIKINE